MARLGRIGAWARGIISDPGAMRAALVGDGALISPAARSPDHRFRDLRAKLAQRPERTARRALGLLLARAVARRGSHGQAMLRSLPQLAPTRALAVEITLRAARFDPDYLRHARAGDKARDSRRWQAAVQHYDALLGLYPLHSGYWVQISHCRKELQKFHSAELGYRNALAYGAPVADVWPHLEHAVRFGGGAIKLYPPGLTEQFERQAAQGALFPDLTATEDLRQLGWLLLGTTDFDEAWQVRMMRAAPERGQVVEQLMLDPAFSAANRRLIALMGRSGFP